MHHLETMTDAYLLKVFSRSASESHAAFTELVKRHGPMVHAVALRVLSNHHDAQEVTQAVFIVLARDAAQLSGKPSVAGWLHTVSRRLSLDARKSRERRQRREQAVMNAINESANANPDATLGAGFRQELDAALECLPDRYRQPLVLFHLEGASLQEIANHLDLQPSTLRTRLSRGRSMLRQLLVHRGVEVASIGLLSSLLAAEAKAVAFTPKLLSAVLDAATGGGAAVSPLIQELIGKAAGAKTTTLSFQLINLTILMKTKTNAVVAIVIALAAAGTTAYVVRQGDAGADRQSRIVARDEASPVDPRADRSKVRKRLVAVPLSGISSKSEFQSVLMSVLLIENDDERLAALRERLGMNISDQTYRTAITAHGYQSDPESLFKHLINAWLDADPHAAMLWARRLPEELGMSQAMLGWWLERGDASAAMAWARENLDSTELERLEQAAGEIGPGSDPESSAATAGRLAKMHEEMLALSGKGETHAQRKADFVRDFADWTNRDVKAAVEFALSLDSNADRFYGVDMIGQAFRFWALSEPDAALERAKGLTDQKQRVAAVCAVLPSWQLKHPDRSIDQVADLSEIPDAQYRLLLYRVVKDMASLNPAHAMDYALGVEERAMRNSLSDTVVGQWVKKQPAEARKWVMEQPAGEVRDIGLHRLSLAISTNDFEASEQLARQIENRELKQESIGRICCGEDAVTNHLPAALKLLESVEQIDSTILGDLAVMVRLRVPEEVQRFRAWLDRTHAAGRIQYSGDTVPEELEPEVGRELNATAAERGYQQILESLRVPQ
jgi:RNA polymerase sigma-70 factor (ECF subfamily)